MAGIFKKNTENKIIKMNSSRNVQYSRWNCMGLKKLAKPMILFSCKYT